MAKYTLLDAIDKDASPTLVFQKWHAYDRFEESWTTTRRGNERLAPFETKASRKAFLESVASRVNEWNQKNYAAWHSTYAATCAALGGEEARSHTTSWRLVVGWSTNPALEVGATLHHLHGFPYIPGSSVKGLLHHFAEMEWMAETMAKLPEPTSLGDEPPEILKEAIEVASLVWTLFGSLVVERAKLKNGSLLGPKGPRERLTPWKERIKEEKLHEQEPWQGVYADLVRLLDTNRGAALTCFDAVPTKAAIQAGMLECDILNPHYPEYYRKEGAGISPSDTENPTPIYFLAVKPGVTFEFRFKLRDDDIHNGTPKNWSREALLEQVEAWLARALSEWGIGGKTSAGYGYFDPPHPVGQKGTPPGARKAKGTDPAGRMERKPPATPAQEARAILPPGLAPSELAQRIDRAPEYPEAVQREIARLFRVHYSQEVKKWRKKKEKPNVAKRLAWVERFSEGGEHDA